MDLMRLPSHPDQQRRRLALLLQSAPVEVADRLAGAAAARELLNVVAAYTPSPYRSEGWSFSLSFVDGMLLGPIHWMWQPAFSSVSADPPLPLPATSRPGAAHEPEVIERWIADLNGRARLRVVGAHLDPRQRSAWQAGETQSGIIVVECEGEAWLPWRRPGRAELPRGTHMVYHDGRILGRAAAEGGAARAAASQPFAPRADHGWRLAETPIGKVWTVRPPDDIAHRIREIHHGLVPLGDQLDRLVELDLSEEHERVLGLIEEIEQLVARAAVLRDVAHLPQRSVPRATKKTTGAV